MNNIMTINDYVNKEFANFYGMASESGYEPISTFNVDLSIAEYYQMRNIKKNAIRETFDRICEEWLSDYKMFTEFTLCLNWKIWTLYRSNDEIAKLYDTLWRKATQMFYDKYEGNEEANEYFFRVTD